MQQLSGLDAVFLALETPAVHMHIMGVAVVDPSTVVTSGYPTFYDRVRGLFEARLPLIPPFRRRVVTVPFGLYVPCWIDDPNFDLDYHIQRGVFGAGAGPGSSMCSRASVASRPLDRNKPLWEAYIVEGLEHGYQAFITKIHHSLIDGVAGVSIIASLFDVDAGASLVPADAPEDPFKPEAVPSETERRPTRGRRGRQSPAEDCARVTRSVPGVVRVVRRVVGRVVERRVPLTAPRRTMNRTITPRIVRLRSRRSRSPT